MGGAHRSENRWTLGFQGVGMATPHRSATLLLAVAAICAAPASSPNDNQTLDRKDPTTHELLSSLGLKKLRIPAAHHRKRLAEQGRRHATGDSRMYVIKLPPNMNYYSHPEPAPAAARTLPLQMKSNGKPARVYHWNLPVIQKLAKNRPQARFDDDVVNVESTPTWPKHPNAIDALAYYVPSKKSSFRKYFSGNGKPKSFYVIEKDKSSAEYHRLLP
ncbi:jg4033 [Pararge aegeria aegeria]|uniref:Jg4033 protein n=1 Tax=Pararge aegeria aegeria TaxID=348720 RepID=A0A8S4R5C1_9NEOP|nr:jg4033 [Pararge aegeria aegeria]